MDGHDIVGSVLALKAGVDTIKSLCGLLPARRRDDKLIPVYRLKAMKIRGPIAGGIAETSESAGVAPQSSDYFALHK